MLNIVVTGKVVKVDAKNAQAGRERTVLWLDERRYADREESHYTWIVIVPAFLDKAVERLCKEGKSIGVTATDLWQVEDKSAVTGQPVAAVIQAETVFIL